MKNEFSAGFVVYLNKIINDKTERFYLILHSAKGHWDLPKGKIEGNETKFETAIRELEEETDLAVDVIPGFEQLISYVFNDNHHAIYKEVTFFLAKAKNENVNLSHEHLSYKWVPLHEAIETLSYTNAKEVISSADQFIDK